MEAEEEAEVAEAAAFDAARAALEQQEGEEALQMAEEQMAAEEAAAEADATKGSESQGEARARIECGARTAEASVRQQLQEEWRDMQAEREREGARAEGGTSGMGTDRAGGTAGGREELALI